MLKKLALGLAAATIALTGLVVTVPAQATTVTTPCNGSWYVNPDETALKPVQKETGFLFDGPSLIHHAAGGLLSNAATDGAFDADVQTGVAPLFKFETTGPYSTINKTGAGLYWSSKIATGVGSQSSPTALATLAETAPYTATTTLLSFGAGYANDQGNKALVKSVTYGKVTYSFACPPPVTTPPTTTKSTTPTSTTVPTTTKSTTPPVTTTSPSKTSAVVLPATTTPRITSVPVVQTSNDKLASTGFDGMWLAWSAGALLLVGGGLLFLTRRKRKA